jgi:hypothetical protein
MLVELAQLLSRVPAREVRVTVRNVKPDLLHPGSVRFPNAFSMPRIYS